MKQFFLILAFLLPLDAFSEMASYLKDGTVFVAIKNGRIYKFSSNQWKVVKRYKDGPDLGKEISEEELLDFFGHLDEETPEPIVEKEIVEKVVEVTKFRTRTHTLIAHLGGANEKYEVTEEEKYVTLRENYEVAFGFSYLYNFQNNWSFGGTFINRTGTLDIAYSFD